MCFECVAKRHRMEDGMYILSLKYLEAIWPFLSGLTTKTWNKNFTPNYPCQLENYNWKCQFSCYSALFSHWIPSCDCITKILFIYAYYFVNNYYRFSTFKQMSNITTVTSTYCMRIIYKRIDQNKNHYSDNKHQSQICQFTCFTINNAKIAKIVPSFLLQLLSSVWNNLLRSLFNRFNASLEPFHVYRCRFFFVSIISVFWYIFVWI